MDRTGRSSRRSQGESLNTVSYCRDVRSVKKPDAATTKRISTDMLAAFKKIVSQIPAEFKPTIVQVNEPIVQTQHCSTAPEKTNHKEKKPVSSVTNICDKSTKQSSPSNTPHPREAVEKSFHFQPVVVCEKLSWKSLQSGSRPFRKVGGKRPKPVLKSRDKSSTKLLPSAPRPPRVSTDARQIHQFTNNSPQLPIRQPPTKPEEIQEKLLSSFALLSEKPKCSPKPSSVQVNGPLSETQQSPKVPDMLNLKEEISVKPVSNNNVKSVIKSTPSRNQLPCEAGEKPVQPVVKICDRPSIKSLLSVTRPHREMEEGKKRPKLVATICDKESRKLLPSAPRPPRVSTAVREIHQFTNNSPQLPKRQPPTKPEEIQEKLLSSFASLCKKPTRSPKPCAKSGGAVSIAAVAAALTARVNELPPPQHIRRFRSFNFRKKKKRAGVKHSKVKPESLIVKAAGVPLPPPSHTRKNRPPRPYRKRRTVVEKPKAPSTIPTQLFAQFSNAASIVIASKATEKAKTPVNQSCSRIPPSRRNQPIRSSASGGKHKVYEEDSDSDEDYYLHSSSESDSPENDVHMKEWNLNHEREVKLETMSDEEEFLIVNLNECVTEKESNHDPLSDQPSTNDAILFKVEDQVDLDYEENNIAEDGFVDAVEIDFITCDIQPEGETDLKMNVKMESLEMKVQFKREHGATATVCMD